MSIVSARRIHKREWSSNVFVLELKRILRAKWLMQGVEDLAARHVVAGRPYPPCSPDDTVEPSVWASAQYVDTINEAWVVMMRPISTFKIHCPRPVFGDELPLALRHGVHLPSKAKNRGPILASARLKPRHLESWGSLL